MEVTLGEELEGFQSSNIFSCKMKIRGSGILIKKINVRDILMSIAKEEEVISDNNVGRIQATKKENK